jgi:hypothetical protein
MSQQALTTIILVLSVVVGVALPVLTVRRYRNPRRHRDAWLGANAQPLLTKMVHAMSALSFAVSGAVVALIGSAFDWPLTWAIVPVTIGGLVSIVITAVMTSRMPVDVEHQPSAMPAPPTTEKP